MLIWDNQKLFITFEGTDGCGKTTQLGLLGNKVRELGREVVETLEPGGTEIGRQIRRILLDPHNSTLHSRAELLLYLASRAQNVEQVIRPALARGALVLCDRFTDSTLAYQGWGRGVELEPILQLDRFACRGLSPDLTILIDINPALSRERSLKRNRQTGSGETRLDDESTAFHKRVCEGFQALAHQHPKRIRVISGAAPIDDVAKLVWAEVHPYVR